MLSGCLGIQLLFSGFPLSASYCILLSGVFDFFDGMVARALKVSSPIGKDLDSLADMVSFGVLPGFLAFHLLSANYDGGLFSGNDMEGGLVNGAYLAYLGFLIPFFSAIRLAIFNHDTRQTDSFIGLPTPANAFFWCGLVVGLENGTWWLLAHPAIIALITILFSVLLVVPLEMFSFKMKSMGWKGNQLRYIFILMAVPVLVVLKVPGFAAVVVMFILFSVFQSWLNKRKFADKEV